MMMDAVDDYVEDDDEDEDANADMRYMTFYLLRL